MPSEKSSQTELPLQYYLENEFHSVVDIFHWVTNLAGSVYTDSTAVVPPEAAYASATISRTHLLSQEFLLNFKRSSLDLGLPLGVSNYFSFAARSSVALRSLSEQEDRDAPDQIVSLPPYQNVNASLGVTIRARRSLREFTGKAMRLQQLSTILFYANGVTGEMPMISAEDDPQWPEYSLGAPEPAQTRAASSGGGLNSISLYVVTQNVEKLDDGIYVYLPVGHSLKRLVSLSEAMRDEHRALGRSWGVNVEPADVNVTLYYVYSVYENARKYADMGLPFALIEAGEIAAHVHLICTATNVGSADMGGWEKVQTERFLGIDGLSKHVVHATVVGML